MKIIHSDNTQDNTTNDDINDLVSDKITDLLTEEEPQTDSPEEAEEERIKALLGLEKMEFEDISSDNSEEVPAEEAPGGEAVEEEKEEPAEEEEEEPSEDYGFFGSLWKNKRRRAKLAYGLVCTVMVVLGTVYGFVNAMLDKVQPEELPQDDTEVVEPVYDEDDFELYSAINSANSLNDYVYQWYNTGSKMSSRNVINVLLIGLDSSSGLKNGGRSDTMMLVSLNRKTEQIKMISFFRDSWVYYKTPAGKEFYSKMNGSYFYGGAECTVETIENVFKIDIDHYVTVDFSSFEDIVDAVGGVRVDVQEYEARNMKREWNLDCPVGEDVLLNGQLALYFARQRYSDADGDVSRTRRQRQVIEAFIESCKGASINQLSDALNKVFKYVRTDLKKTEILSYATKALSGGWLSYDISSVKISDPSVFKTPTINKVSLVIMDYPVVAKLVQEEIYGTTNIVLEENRVSIFNLY